jgi:excisionase family DNA binding protein
VTGDYLTAAEVAELLGVSSGRVRQLTMEGTLTAEPPIAGRRFYHRKEVERLVRERATHVRSTRSPRKI